MTDFGTVVSVQVDTLGDELAADAGIGAGTLTVIDPADFSEDGGTLQVGAETLVYTACDDETGIITLAGVTVAAHVTGDRVNRYPIGQEKWATVALDDETEAISALVPQSLWAYLAEGIRTGTGEQVLVAEIADELWQITDVVGAIPLFDGALTDPESTIPPPALSDGIPPLVAPTSVAAAAFAIRAGRVSWLDPGNPDPLHYKVYWKNAAGVTTADQSLTTWSLSAVIDNYAAAPLDPTVTYYAKVSALDADGEGPLSSEVSFTPRQADNDDLSADEVFAIKVEAAGIQTGTMGADLAVAGSLYVSDFDPATGLPVDGTVKFKVDGDGSVRGYDGLGVERLTLDPATGSFVFRGDGEFDHLTVVNGSIQGGANEIAEGATLTLEKGVTTPQNPPSVLIDYQTLNLTGSSEATHFGLAKAGAFWYTVGATGTNYRIEKYDATTGVLAASGAVYPGRPTGIAYNGTDFYVFIKSLNLVVRHSGTTLALLDDSAWVHADGGRTPSIGWDTGASEILIAQSRAVDDKVRVRRYTFNAGGTLTNSATSPVDCTTTYPQDLAAVLYGTHDFSGLRYVFMKRDAAGAVQVMNTSGVEQAGDEFPTSAITTGMWWDPGGANFYTLDTSMVLRLYETGSGNRWTTSTDENWYAAYTWYRATGTLETLRSPYTAFTMKKRARVTIQTPDLPATSATPPSEARVYLKKGVSSPGTNPATVNMKRQASTTGSPPTLTVVNASFAASDNPATSGFGATGTAAVIDASDGSVLMSASDTDQAWTPVVTAVSTNPTGYTATGRYKVDGDRWATIEFFVTLGAGAPAGQLSISLPIALLNRRAQYKVSLWDTSATQYYEVVGVVDVSTKDSLLMHAQPGTAGVNLRAMNATVPITLATGDVIHGVIRAQKA